MIALRIEPPALVLTTVTETRSRPLAPCYALAREEAMSERPIPLLAIAATCLWLASSACLAPPNADDDVADDDTTAPGDDDSALDDDDVEVFEDYVHEQSLEGIASAIACPGCEFTYDITYTTTAISGTCDHCRDLADGVHTLGYDVDYYYGGGQYELIFYYYGGAWHFWYTAYAGYGGHDVAFWMWETYDQEFFYQYGYWELTGQGQEIIGYVYSSNTELEEEPPGSYECVQSLAGIESAEPCPQCEFVFDITYTTTHQTGTCTMCWDFDDGVHTLGYDADYVYDGYSYEVVLLYMEGYDAWVFWYSARTSYGGHDLTFYFYDPTYYFYQYGYWDMSGSEMTGLATTVERW